MPAPDEPEWIAPLQKIQVTSPFGERFHPVLHRTRMHEGVDLRAAVGTPVYAAAAGTVAAIGSGSGYGNMLIVDHGNGWKTRYAHLSQIKVANGEHVKAGEPIARSGESGLTNGPHLHFELLHNGRAVDPVPHLQPTRAHRRAQAAIAATEAILAQRGDSDAQGKRFYRGLSYDIDRDKSSLSLRAHGKRGEILKVVDGQVVTNHLNSQDAAVLGSVRQQLLKERQPAHGRQADQIKAPTACRAQISLPVSFWEQSGRPLLNPAAGIQLTPD
ncbi:M23 family metallopeptidase [Gloeobacter kilaueensis]|uniref:Peptidase M23 n=1 Tax=Gloeobacter kilaueensis (strain ATCC BAA-2537 / CCAP 1431/1 / ULC 316 / JS1) TaxID=1183438 RepID=U5QGU6_GLOK1|nr:M23 family metallopeptidase [Gloeobacter kilaueensis]AGY56860.1 peptidase M23 [Gloeobacter kilaueensis JS1]